MRTASDLYRLTRCGFTDDQARGVAMIVAEATADAVDALRDELARWHAYLALYLLAQISLVLLAALLLIDTTPPSTRGRVALQPGGIRTPNPSLGHVAHEAVNRFESDSWARQAGRSPPPRLT